MVIETKKYRIVATPENGVVILDDFEVFPPYRGKGIAKKAMKRFLNRCQGKTIELHAYSGSEISNEKLRDFYACFGFCAVAGSEEIGFEMIKKNNF